MEMKKICPLMGGNVCREEMCALWPQVGKVCTLNQIGASLAAINSGGLSVDIDCEYKPGYGLGAILNAIEKDLDAIARYV